MADRLHCPTCERPGRTVPTQTVDGLVAEERRAVLGAGPLSLCETADCPVVYFDSHNRVVQKRDVRVRVFQKETDPSRPVCYCFGHSVSDVLDARRADGSNRVVDEIMAACRRGLDRCEEENPQGRCCLGNVRGLLRAPAAAACCGGNS